MWLGTKRMERFAKARLSPVSKPRHINCIFTVNAPILYMFMSTKKLSDSREKMLTWEKTQLKAKWSVTYINQILQLITKKSILLVVYLDQQYHKSREYNTILEMEIVFGARVVRSCFKASTNKFYIPVSREYVYCVYTTMSFIQIVIKTQKEVKHCT